MPSRSTKPIKAIAAKCRQCKKGSLRDPSLIEDCKDEKCALFYLRPGATEEMPKREPRQMSEEQRAAARERLAKARAVRAANKAAQAGA